MVIPVHERGNRTQIWHRLNKGHNAEDTQSRDALSIRGFVRSPLRTIRLGEVGKEKRKAEGPNNFRFTTAAGEPFPETEAGVSLL